MTVKVACCWDDGVCNDIRLIHLLRKYGAKATFNLNPGLMEDERVTPRWAALGENFGYQGYFGGHIGLREVREVYQGFQVASHCWKHENIRNHADVFVAEALHARRWLEDTFERPCLGFAWPNGAASPEFAAQLREAGFAYGRTTMNTDAVTKCAEPLMLNPTCRFNDREFYRKFDDAKAGDGVFYFWGHSYEMMDCEELWNQFENHLKYIAADPGAEWVDVIDLVPLLHA